MDFSDFISQPHASPCHLSLPRFTGPTKPLIELGGWEEASLRASLPVAVNSPLPKRCLPVLLLAHARSKSEEIAKQRAHERYMKLQEQGKTEQARTDLECLALIRQQRAVAAKKREEEKAAKDQKKAEARK